MPNSINILLGVLAMIALADSWYTYFIVKDGLARLILLWGNALLFSMMFFRTLGFILYEVGVLDIFTSRTWNQYVIFFIYIIIIAQQMLQRSKFKK